MPVFEQLAFVVQWFQIDVMLFLKHLYIQSRLDIMVNVDVISIVCPVTWCDQEKISSVGYVILMAYLHFSFGNIFLYLRWIYVT